MSEIRAATLADLNAVDELRIRCTADLDARAIYQWDDSYPSREFLSDSIEEGSLYVLVEATALRGMVTLDTWQSPEWLAIPWQHLDGSSLVIHALAIDPAHQRCGYGRALLAFAEELARDQGYDGLRLDVFSENEAAIGLYERAGCTYRGAVTFASKPAGHDVYLCYEKWLKEEMNEQTI